MDDFLKDELVDVVRSLLPTLPEVQQVVRLHTDPTDVFVMECAVHMTPQTVQRITDNMKAVWPENKCIVIDAGMKLKVLRERDVKVSPIVNEAADQIRIALRVARESGQPDRLEDILEAMINKVQEER